MIWEIPLTAFIVMGSIIVIFFLHKRDNNLTKEKTILNQLSANQDTLFNILTRVNNLEIKQHEFDDVKKRIDTLSLKVGFKL